MAAKSFTRGSQARRGSGTLARMKADFARQNGASKQSGLPHLEMSFSRENGQEGVFAGLLLSAVRRFAVAVRCGGVSRPYNNGAGRRLDWLWGAQGEDALRVC